MSKIIPDIAFMGICERSKYITTGEPYTWNYNILGLRDILWSYIYPLNLKGFQFAFAIYDAMNIETAQISFMKPNNEELMHFDFELMPKVSENNDVLTIENQEIVQQQRYIGNEILSKIFSQTGYPVWSLFIITLNKDVFVMEPCQHKVILKKDEMEITIGCLNFGYREINPLTSDRIAAIRGNPNSLKTVRMKLSCNKCQSTIGAYVGIEKDLKLERDGYFWYSELPLAFGCNCGENTFNLKYLRNNMHALLGDYINEYRQELSFSKLYEKGAIESIISNFSNILNKEPSEETIQQFIRENPIILQQFSPERIFYKTPILSKYKSDITILNHKKELILIELEKPSTKLLKQDGGICAELQHPIDQIRDWIFTAENHRLAVLDCIGLKQEEVSKIRGVIIAGRDKDYQQDSLRQLRWTDFGHGILFFTYDDLLRDLVLMVSALNNL